MAWRLPTLNGLRTFEAAARHLSFTRAAAELNVTQAAVSHQIRVLEDQLGLKLFVRRNRRLALTEAGRRYLPAVSAAFASLHEATLQLAREERAGTLTVSTLASFATKWLVPRLGAFQARHPDIDVRIATGTDLVDFASGDIDMAIRYGRGDWPGVKAERLVTEDVFPVCAPSLLEGGRPLAVPADLANHTLLHVTAYPEDWRVWLTAAGVDNVDPTHGIFFDLALTAIQAATEGLGVALGRDPLVAADLSAGRLIAPFEFTLPSESAYYVVAPAERWQAPKIAAFREWLRAIAAREGHVVAGS